MKTIHLSKGKTNSKQNSAKGPSKLHQIHQTTGSTIVVTKTIPKNSCIYRLAFWSQISCGVGYRKHSQSINEKQHKPSKNHFAPLHFACWKIHWNFVLLFFLPLICRKIFTARPCRASMFQTLERTSIAIEGRKQSGSRSLSLQVYALKSLCSPLKRVPCGVIWCTSRLLENPRENIYNIQVWSTRV